MYPNFFFLSMGHITVKILTQLPLGRQLSLLILINKNVDYMNMSVEGFVLFFPWRILGCNQVPPNTRVHMAHSEPLL